MKILWASPFNLHDTSSGAALQVRIMLESLHKRGVQCRALAAFVFDNPSGASFFTDLKKQYNDAPDTVFFNLQHEGISYQYMRTRSTHIADFCDAEQRKFFQRYCQTLVEFRPDLILMYGGGMLEMVLRAEARRRGIPSVYALENGNHGGYSFPDVDLIITDSQATANMYARRDSILVEPAGVFIDPAMVVAAKREPKYITFVNPATAKGVAFVARIAQMAQEQLPDEKFLVVQSRGDWFQVLPQLKTGDAPLDPKQYPNVDVTNHAKDMRPIYAATKVLLAPSLWYESFGRVATEACMNGIPVVASTSGGLPEAVGDGGILLETPERCRKDHHLVPTPEEAQPWLDALKSILASKASLQDWGNKAKEAAKAHSIDRSTDRVLEQFAPFFARRAGSNPQFYRSGSSTTR